MPDLGQGNPEGAVKPAQSGPWRRSAEGGELLAKGEVVERELGTAAERRAECGEQVQERGEHGWTAHAAISDLPFLRIHSLTDGK